MVQGFFVTQPRPSLPQAGGLPVQSKPAAGIDRLSRATPLPPAFRLPAGPGQPLPDGVRGAMEQALRSDFSAVRVHVGGEAAAIGALAFTCGDRICFAPGQYDPHTTHGRRLLGHELAHVVQQRSGRVRNPQGSGLTIIRDPLLEAEANRLGTLAASQPLFAAPPLRPTPAQPMRRGGTLQRMMSKEQIERINDALRRLSKKNRTLYDNLDGAGQALVDQAVLDGIPILDALMDIVGDDEEVMELEAKKEAADADYFEIVGALVRDGAPDDVFWAVYDPAGKRRAKKNLPIDCLEKPHGANCNTDHNHFEIEPTTGNVVGTTKRPPVCHIAPWSRMAAIIQVEQAALGKIAATPKEIGRRVCWYNLDNLSTGAAECNSKTATHARDPQGWLNGLNAAERKSAKDYVVAMAGRSARGNYGPVHSFFKRKK